VSTIGDRLRKARMRKVWTQDDLARLSGVAVVTISRIESGEAGRLPRQSTVRKLAEALDVDGAWLLFGDAEEAEVAGNNAS
jgi:transcriptional regulator with XRE-family HTH domain